MKKLYFLSGIIALSAIMNINAGEYRQPSVEEVMRGKIGVQKELARPSAYKMIDTLINQQGGVFGNTDWTTLFGILDSMRGVINVNEYRYPEGGYLLLQIAVYQKNLLAANRLVQQYKANPNLPGSTTNWEPQSPLMQACMRNNLPMVTLLLRFGGNPAIKDADGKDCFYYAKRNPEILAALRSN